MVTTCPHTKFHLPQTNGLLVTAIKLVAKHRPKLHAAAMLFHILHRLYFNKSCIFFEYSKLCGANVTSASKARASAMLLLLMVGN